MDILVSIIPELVAVVIAVGVAVARTTENSLDDKVAKLASDNKKAINRTLRDLVEDENKKQNR